MTVPKNSRWNRTTILIVQDRLGTETRKPYLLPIRPRSKVNFQDNRTYTPIRGDTWSNMAFRFLGDSTLWWVITEFNYIVDPVVELESRIVNGTSLIIPSVNRTNFEILRFGRNRLLV